MARHHVFFGLSALVVIAVALFALNLFRPLNLSLLTGSSDDAASKAKILVELSNPSSTVSVVKVDDVSGLYKVFLKIVDVSGATNYIEVYVTKDGKLLTPNVIFVDQQIGQINRTQKFVDCLYNKGVRIFGLVNQTATVLQFNLIGGIYAAKLFASCDGQLAQQCVNAGITQVPATVYNNTGYPGVRSVEFLQNLTSCTY